MYYHKTHKHTRLFSDEENSSSAKVDMASQYRTVL